MSQLVLRHYGSTFRYINRDPEQTTLLRSRRKTITVIEDPSVREARHKIKTALRIFAKGGLH